MTAISDFVETGCVFNFNGKSFESGGAMKVGDTLVGYLGNDGRTLQTWHEEKIGTYQIVASWRTPRSYMSSHMYQVQATVDGVLYTGRSAGRGMIFKGKRATKHPLTRKA